MRLHIGKRVPKGFVELPGAIHIGKGIWMFRIERMKEPQAVKARNDSTRVEAK